MSSAWCMSEGDMQCDGVYHSLGDAPSVFGAL
jgi:hypothetical protein